MTNLYDIIITYVLPYFINVETCPVEALTFVKCFITIGLAYIGFWLIVWLPFKLFRKIIKQ